MKAYQCLKIATPMDPRGKTSCALAAFMWLVSVIATNGSQSHVYKTIETANGDVYECVDMHRQPSLQHPALKGHKVQVRSSPLVGKSKIGLVEGCPLGSVPILKHDHVKLANSTPKLTSQNITQPLQDSAPGILFSGLTTKGSQQISGAFAFYSIYNPKLTAPDQRSSAILALESRNGGSYSRVEAGWTVNPKLYEDSSTRLYAFWTTDESRSTGCFDTRCPGFIQTSDTKPLGFAFPSISSPGKEYFEVSIEIVKDTEGVYLSVDGQELGYWPYNIVPNMENGPLEVKWGGEVFMPDTRIPYPQMGSGAYDTLYAFDYNAYLKNVQMYDENLANIIPTDGTVELSICQCYLVGGNKYRDDKDQYRFVYGGSGGVIGKDCHS